jgi:16S rRNA (guanine527-N7)-methyltransferase
MTVIPSEARIQELLQPFGVDLSADELAQVRTYLELLLRWNAKINLTSIRDPELSVTRHFGETLFLGTRDELRGRLLDIGSGAGFPGLALKIVFPDLHVTLLEPVAKKRAFLKEVVRSCEMDEVDVRPERAEEIARAGTSFNLLSSRGVGHMETLIAACCPVLSETAKIYLWTTQSLSRTLHSDLMTWVRHIPIPKSQEREIIVGVRRGGFAPPPTVG